MDSAIFGRLVCGLLDIAGCYRPLLAFLDHAAPERLVRAEHRDLVPTYTDPAERLDATGHRLRVGLRHGHQP